MRTADIGRLLLLGMVWGCSFLFIRVIVPVLGPVVTAESRVLIAGLALLLYAMATKTKTELRERWQQYLVLGALNSAFPFLLICTAELRLTASMGAILNATSPLFGAMLSALWRQEALTLRKVSGIFVAIAGVVILVGWSPLVLNRSTVLSIGASLLAALCYGLAGLYSRLRMKGAPSLGMAVGGLLGACLLMAPLVPFAPPFAPPTGTVLLCLLTLGLLSTAFAYILYFRLIVDVGPTHALTVTFLTPVFGVLWGMLFLHEAVTASKMIGGSIVLFGAGLVVGLRSDFFRKTLPAK